MPKHVWHWDDEREFDNGIIVTLQYGFSFHANKHLGVMGFDTFAEAREAVKRKNVYPANAIIAKAINALFER